MNEPNKIPLEKLYRKVTNTCGVEDNSLNFIYKSARDIFCTICKRQFKTNSFDLAEIIDRDVQTVNRGIRQYKQIETQTDFISLSIRMAYIKCEAEIKRICNCHKF